MAGEFGNQRRRRRDDSPRPTRPGQTGGLYAAELVNDVVNMPPALRCPNCQSTCVAVADAAQLYQQRVSANGKSHSVDIVPCPIAGFELPLMVYSLDPCGCRVSAEWASAFARELVSRLSGNHPRPVAAMTPGQHQDRRDFLVGTLSRLYTEIDAATSPEATAAAQTWAVIVADQIQRLCPGEHNRTVVARRVDPAVFDWARENGIRLTTTEPSPEREVFEESVPPPTLRTLPVGFPDVPSVAAPKPDPIVRPIDPLARKRRNIRWID